jgi:hypothetical protein
MALEAVQAQAGYASIVCQHLPGVENPLLRGIYDHPAPCVGRTEVEVRVLQNLSITECDAVRKLAGIRPVADRPDQP